MKHESPHLAKNGGKNVAGSQEEEVTYIIFKTSLSSRKSIRKLTTKPIAW
jgi:hypothetical protein